MPGGGRVLVVEDEPMVAAMMADALSDRGFEVVTMRSGEAALGYLKHGGVVDVLFTDIELAERMDGATLARMAREIAPGLAVVYASGVIGRVDRPVPGSVVLRKPYGPDEACGLVARVRGGLT